MKQFIAEKWRQILKEQGLADFEALWNLQLKALDIPNEDRGGWSEVSLLPLELPDGHKNRLIIKRQQGHTSFSIRHPFRGIPTFEKEFYNILRCKKLDIPTIEPVYFARRRSPDGLQAVLITEYLEKYTTLKELENTWKKKGHPDNTERNSVITAVASLVNKLHTKGLQHNCLYPKHLFILQEEGKTNIRLIDLENTRWRPFGNGRKVRDLETLYRRTMEWSRTDRLRFFKAYCGVESLDANVERLCRQILRRNEKKMRH